MFSKILGLGEDFFGGKLKIQMQWIKDHKESLFPQLPWIFSGKIPYFLEYDDTVKFLRKENLYQKFVA